MSKKYKSPNNFSLNKCNNCVTRLAIPWTAMTGCQYWVSWKSWEGSTEIIKIKLIIQNWKKNYSKYILKLPLNYKNNTPCMHQHHYNYFFFTYWLISCKVCFWLPGKDDLCLGADLTGVISKVLWSEANNFLALFNIFLQDWYKDLLASSSAPMSSALLL